MDEETLRRVIREEIRRSLDYCRFCGNQGHGGRCPHQPLGYCSKGEFHEVIIEFQSATRRKARCTKCQNWYDENCSY